MSKCKAGDDQPTFYKWKNECINLIFDHCYHITCFVVFQFVDVINDF